MMEMNKKYHFVKIRDKKNESSSGTWYLEADSIDAIYEHFKKYVGAEIKMAIKEILSKGQKTMGHFTNNFAALVVKMMEIGDGRPFYIVATELENNMLQTRLKGYSNNLIQYLTDSLSVLIDSPNIEIIEEIYKDTLVYPHEEKPDLNDVRYMTWYGGKHYYAKIGKIDIVDKDNNQKWNTEKEAKEAAKWYIEKYF